MAKPRAYVVNTDLLKDFPDGCVLIQDGNFHYSKPRKNINLHHGFIEKNEDLFIPVYDRVDVEILCDVFNRDINNENKFWVIKRLAKYFKQK